MKINGIEGLSTVEINQELQRGGKFVFYQYCISLIVVTFRRSSDVYFIKSDESDVKKGLGWSLLTFLLGWWGFPWGPIYSVGSLATNFKGGKNVTNEILEVVNSQSR